MNGTAHPWPEWATISIDAPAAAEIELWTFEAPDPGSRGRRVSMVRDAQGIWRATEPLPHGQAYALRADGPAHARDRWLLDPRARAIGRLPAPLDPVGVVVDPWFDWAGDRRPATPWRETVIYEAHVKGLTARHPDVPPVWRGTFLGVTVPAVIDHLRRIGVTAIELLPIHAHADEPALVARGLVNYWGYNTLGFFAPDPRFAVSRHPADAVRECQTMVRALHRAGLEVILDVVYNHTAEGPDPLGPAPGADRDGRVLSLRGFDGEAAYRRDGDRTGCGNTLDAAAPRVRTLILDSLRYWATVMRVDGFRFDLASALDRAPEQAGSLFDEIRRDPVLGALKLIVEPWDATGEGYRLGGFPRGIAEWNGRYRDDVRRFWRGDASAAGALATRLAGSADLFGGRGPSDSLNFVTAHDGFTLVDLVSYAAKHNDANGEGNRDGESQNHSSNAGVEGPADDPAIAAERRARQRALIATLFVSLGVPMLSGGDELGRTQSGNNNAYCHDSPLTWTPWPGDTALAAFVARAAAARRAVPAFRRDAHLTAADASWWSPDGRQLEPRDWESGALACFGLHLAEGDQAAWVWVNAARDAREAVLPDGHTWTFALDSSAEDAEHTRTATGRVTVPPVAVCVLTRSGR